jgi:hypothetical protein
VAEVLNRKRALSLNMIRRLYVGLGIPAEVLVRPYAVAEEKATYLIDVLDSNAFDRTAKGGTCMPTASDFQTELNMIFQNAQNRGLPYVDVKSGDLHRRVGGYPGHDHRMPVCCGVMRQNLNASDTVLSEPPKGSGATLKIRYQIPR